jgi:hypothetical protein
VNHPPKVVRILQELSAAKCERDVENVLWEHRDFINSMPNPVRELFHVAVLDAVRELDRRGA